MKPRLVLASASPRRADILRQLGLSAEIRPADVDESVEIDEQPGPHVERLARSKAEAVQLLETDAYVIGGDTVVVHEGAILGKPADVDEAVHMLLGLSGASHDVLSGIAIAGPGGTVSAVARTRVHFRTFDEAFARAYVATGEPMDKAGAYGIQGLGAALVDTIEGDFYSVVGFPIVAFLTLLDKAGLEYEFGVLRVR